MKRLFSIILLTVLFWASLFMISPALAGDESLIMEKITYPSEGANVQGQLYRPKDKEGPLPAIVFCPGRSADFKGMEWLTKPLANAGFVVLAIGYRGIPVRYYLEDVKDVLNALSYLENLAYVDKNRLGIYGHSRGGKAALLSTAKDKKRIKSTVSSSAPIDHAGLMVGMRYASDVLYTNYLRGPNKPLEEDPEYYRLISPTYYAHEIKSPILLIHGANDFLTPPDHSLNMYGALRSTGNKDARIELIVGAGHFFERGFDGYAFKEVVEIVIPWFIRTLAAKN